MQNILGKLSCGMKVKKIGNSRKWMYRTLLSREDEFGEAAVCWF